MDPASNSAADVAAILADYVPKADYEAALDELQSTITERDGLKTEHKKSSERAQELEGKHRARVARDAYEKLVEKLKIDPKFKDDVFDLAKVPADSDEPDPGKIEAAVSKFLSEKKQYLAVPEAKPTKIAAAEGGGRGSAAAPDKGEFRATRKQLADAVWMKSNQSAVSAANKAGALVIDDD